MEKENRVFWNKTGECFAGRKFGADITEFFFDESGKCINKARLMKLHEEGKVSEEKPDNPEKAEEKELNLLRESVKVKNTEIADLKDKLKSIPDSLGKAKTEFKKLNDEISTVYAELDKASNEITNLDAELKNANDEITKLKSKQGKKNG